MVKITPPSLPKLVAAVHVLIAEMGEGSQKTGELFTTSVMDKLK